KWCGNLLPMSNSVIFRINGKLSHILAYLLTQTLFMTGGFMPLSAQSYGIFTNYHGVRTDVVFNPTEQRYHLPPDLDGAWAYREVAGNFIASAEIELPPQTDYSLAGWQVHMDTSQGTRTFQAGLTQNASTRSVIKVDGRVRGDSGLDPEDKFYMVQVERTGDTLIFRAAEKGMPLREIQREEWAKIPGTIQLGLFYQDYTKTFPATFHNVRLDLLPAEASDNPNIPGATGSRLEIMDVFTGERQIIYTDKNRFEAPNWLPDGQHLLFNQDGKLFKIPVEGGTPALLNTGFADRNNNDHGISFDGKKLAISHHRPGMPEGGSTVYVLPLTGGTPQLVTPLTPSYWHGWAPDNEHVVYVAKRGEDPSYHIFQAHIHTRQETQLTSFQGAHVDGPEYDPSGEFIYYNGSQSGAMKLWRMRPDGTRHEQLTSDEWYDWFPHISPDGKWIAFLSFPPNIGANDHPANKRVMLRLMPVSGGEPKVIAWLYGGQGTINVPSWSPDSQKIAFVSYYGREE
ncbi:MAG: hypothetical protein AAFV07_00735, partial [Bacteroidota bacterium]